MGRETGPEKPGRRGGQTLLDQVGDLVERVDVDLDRGDEAQVEVAVLEAEPVEGRPVDVDGESKVREALLKEVLEALADLDAEFPLLLRLADFQEELVELVVETSLAVTATY